MAKLSTMYLRDRMFDEMRNLYKVFGVLDSKAVERFAIAMKDKMKVSRKKGRGGWDDPDRCTPEDLAEMLIDHVRKGDPVDVGNFCMMLYNRPDARGVLAKVAKQRGL